LKGHGQKFTRKMEAAVAAVLTESTYERAAAKAGICLATLKRWKQMPEFKRALRAARLDILEQVGDLYLQMGKRAAVVVYECMADDCPHVVRLRAAADANQQLRDLVGITQVKEEIAELRALLEAKGHDVSGAVSTRNGTATRGNHR
jgi:hypothetical protein